MAQVAMCAIQLYACGMVHCLCMFMFVCIYTDAERNDKD